MSSQRSKLIVASVEAMPRNSLMKPRVEPSPVIKLSEKAPSLAEARAARSWMSLASSLALRFSSADTSRTISR